MDASFLSVADLGLIPVVIGVVGAIKATDYVADRYVPLVSILVGVGGSFIFPAVSVGLTILAGVVIGLSASGLYSGTKTVAAG